MSNIDEQVQDRGIKTWYLRCHGATMSEIGEVLPRLDGDGTGVTKPMVRKILIREVGRRMQEAATPEEVREIFQQARMRSMAWLRDEALERLQAKEAA